MYCFCFYFSAFYIYSSIPLSIHLLIVLFLKKNHTSSFFSFFHFFPNWLRRALFGGGIHYRFTSIKDNREKFDREKKISSMIHRQEIPMDALTPPPTWLQSFRRSRALAGPSSITDIVATMIKDDQLLLLEHTVRLKHLQNIFIEQFTKHLQVIRLWLGPTVVINCSFSIRNMFAKNTI
jgi:hypothetical protein